jgi:hypothetical protein
MFSVYTNLEVILKSKTTNEEAYKEVTRMMGNDDLFEGYDEKLKDVPMAASTISTPGCRPISLNAWSRRKSGGE